VVTFWINIFTVFLALFTPLVVQVYLLTPMDRAMLFNAKLTISHCPPSITIRQRVSVDSKLLCRRLLAHIWK